MDSQFESNRIPYRRQMFGRQAFSSDKEVYQFPTNGPSLRTYSGNLSMMYNDNNYQQQSDINHSNLNQQLDRRYSLQAVNFDPLNNYQTLSYTNADTICDKYDPTSSSINLTNERLLPFVPPSSAKSTSLTSNMVLNNQLDTFNHQPNLTSSLHQSIQSQRLMPRLPFKSHSTESKLIGNQNSNYLTVRTRPIVEPDDCYDTNIETTFTSGRRLSGNFGYTPNYLNQLNKAKLNESIQRRLLDNRMDVINGANYLVNSNNFNNQSTANFLDANSKPIQSTIHQHALNQANASGFNIFNSAKNLLSGSMSSLIGNNRNTLNTMNSSTNLQVPSMNYLTSDFTNSASNSSVLTNSSNLTQTTTLNPLNSLQTNQNKNYPLSNKSNKVLYGTNRFNLFNSNNPRILLRQESDQTDMRKHTQNRGLHSSASYSIAYPGALTNNNGDNYLSRSTIVNQSRASTIKPNYLKFDKRNRLKYQLSFSSAEEDLDDEFHSSDCSLDYDDDSYLIQPKRHRRQKIMPNYNKSFNSDIIYNNDCLDDEDEYEMSLDEHFNLHNKRQQFRLTHGRQFINDKIQSKLLLSPITWLPSEDNHHLIGHIILNNNLIKQLQHQRLTNENGDELLFEENGNYANVLGLSVIDGSSYGIQHGAIIEKVNSGSIANLICKLRKGDKILKWNKTFLINKTYEQIYDIINESKHEQQLEIVVERKRSFTAQPSHLNHNIQSIGHSSFESKLTPSNRLNKNVLTRQSSLTSDLPKRRLRISRSSTISGRLQVRCWYDIIGNQLVTTIVSAVELPPCANGHPRNTFCRIILLPDKFKKRTKLVVGTNEPLWNQSFVYPSIKRPDLKNKLLEIKLFHLDEYSTELLGCVLIELSTAPLENENEWYLLESYEEILGQLRQYQKFKYLSVDRLSPSCSTVSCLSDSDLSELDLVEYHSELTYSKNKDNYPMLLAETSQSSFGTSISSPSQMHLQQCPTQIQQLPSSSAGYNLANNVQQYPTAHDSRNLFRRAHSPKLPYYSASLPQPNIQHSIVASIPHQTSLNTAPISSNRFGLPTNRLRQFRKCQSQPSRSLSPGSLRSYSPLLFDPLNPSANQYTLNRINYNRAEMAVSRANSPLKRQLPQLPPQQQPNLNMNLNVTNNYNLHPTSFDMSDTTMMGAYQPNGPSRYSHQQQQSSIATAAGHSSALSNYEVNRYKQHSKSSILLPYNRSLDGVRSPQGMYSDSELNRQYQYGNYRSPSQFAQHQYPNQQPQQPIFYHQYHKGGDYTSMSREEVEEEKFRNFNRHAKSKQKQQQQQYYIDANDAKEDIKYLKDQHPSKHRTQQHQQQSQDGYDENEQQLSQSNSSRKHSLRKNSLNESQDQFEKSFEQNNRHQLESTSASRHRKSSHHLPGNEISSSNQITSIDQLAEMDILDDNQRIETTQVRNGDTNKHRKIRNKACSNVMIDESGGESESSSLSKSVTSTVSQDCKKISRTAGDFTKRNSNFGPVHPKQRAQVIKSMEHNSIEEQDERCESSPETVNKLIDENNLEIGDNLNKNRNLKGKKVNVRSNGALDKNSETSTSNVNLAKIKSSSTSQLSNTGTKKRLGFRRKQATTFSVHRSEEVAPEDVRHLVKQTSSVSSDAESLSGESGNNAWVPSVRLNPNQADMSNFVGGLGAGQTVGRQALASPYLGEIQLSICERMCERITNLEVEVIRGRSFQPKPDSKVLPAPYVKVSLIKAGKVIAKAKTSTARRTLDPLYQQTLVFNENYRGCMLQIAVWGDYGRMEKKFFMGVVQIILDELDLTNTILNWYPLFHPSSLITLPTNQKQQQSQQQQLMNMPIQHNANMYMQENNYG